MLALYGDLVKRVLAPSMALIALYAAAVAILAAMLLAGRAGGHRARATPLSTLAGLLIAIYLAQLPTSFTTDIVNALVAAAYMCVPLAFLFVIPRAYPQFDLRALAVYTTLMMIPVHAVGLIQQFVSPSFMISTAYGGELGGVIARNFLDEGTFNRFPSLFVSADRYSGVAMVQIFLTFLLLPAKGPPSGRTLAWVVLNLAAGLTSLLVAGARSRILIVLIALSAAGIVFLTGAVRRRLSRRAANVAFGVVGALIAVLVAISANGSVRQRLGAFPVLSMLGQTIDQGEIGDRVGNSLSLSQAPDDVTIFGEGLGVTGGGRPGEFGILTMWIEGGLFWTPIMLMIHAAILFWLGRTVLRAASTGNALLTLLAAGQGLAWLFALLAGLSSTFELSQALLLFPMIAAVSMTSSRRPAKAPRPALIAEHYVRRS